MQAGDSPSASAVAPRSAHRSRTGEQPGCAVCCLRPLAARFPRCSIKVCSTELEEAGPRLPFNYVCHLTPCCISETLTLESVWLNLADEPELSPIAARAQT